MTLIINLASYKASSRQEAEDMARRIFLPFAQPAEDEGPHTHVYSIVLACAEESVGYELGSFEAPCAVEDAAANIRAIVQALRETADEVEAGHADVLAEDATVPADVLVDLLGLVGVMRTEAEVMGWTDDQRTQAQAWASATHLSASDNDVAVPARPEFLTEEG